ncbi:MAG: hypothetical protein E6507_08555 [Prevotella bivia]|nr:hypothetical protein [Prevotella bivia]
MAGLTFLSKLINKAPEAMKAAKGFFKGSEELASGFGKSVKNFFKGAKGEAKTFEKAASEAEYLGKGAKATEKGAAKVEKASASYTKGRGYFNEEVKEVKKVSTTHQMKEARKVVKNSEEAAKEVVVEGKKINSNLSRVGKFTYSEAKKAINTAAGWGGNVAKFSAQHPLVALFGGALGYHYATGRPGIQLYTNMLSGNDGKDIEQSGAVRVFGEALFGKNTSIAGGVTDLALGKGTAAEVSYYLHQILGEAGGLWNGAKGTAVGLKDELVNLYTSGKDKINGFTGNGQVVYPTGATLDPTAPNFPGGNEVQYDSNGQPIMPQGMVAQSPNMMVSGAQKILSNIHGGNIGTRELMELASAAFAFSRGGLMMKGLGTLLGYDAFKNINQKQPQMMQQPTLGYGQGNMPQYGNTPKYAPVAAEVTPEEEIQTVHRSR